MAFIPRGPTKLKNLEDSDVQNSGGFDVPTCQPVLMGDYMPRMEESRSRIGLVGSSPELQVSDPCAWCDLTHYYPTNICRTYSTLNMWSCAKAVVLIAELVPARSYTGL